MTTTTYAANGILVQIYRVKYISERTMTSTHAISIYKVATDKVKMHIYPYIGYRTNTVREN